LSFYSSVSNSSSQVTSANLRFGTKYYWRARARHTVDTTLWSPTWNFTTINQIALVSPTSGAINQSPDVVLDWNLLSGITNYDYQWDTTATFNSPLSFYSSVSNSSSQVTSANLRFGTKYYWRARARHTADTTLWSPTWNFTTINQIALVSPTSGAINQSPNVVLDWNLLSGITNYDFQWDTTATFNSPLSFYSSVSNSSSQVTSANLRFGTKYYWRARARHTVDTTLWSPTWNFTTIEYITHVSPANNAISISLNPIIDWNLMSGITGYQYRYSTDANFSNPSLFTISNSTSQATLSNLSYGTQYFWQVRAFHTADTSLWSIPWNFTTLYQITTAPILVSPANNTTNVLTTGTTLTWNSVSGATLYQYQLDNNNSFTNPVSNTTTNLNTLTGNLTPNLPYFWRVRAGNGSGFSPWSTIWTFSVGTPCTTYNINENITVCSGASHTFPDGYVQNNITTGFVHVSNLQTVALCDSIINTTINVNTVDATVTVTNNTLSATATGVTYVWVDCNNNFTPIPNQTQQSFTPTTNGAYAVIVTSGNCSATSACFVITTVGINDKFENESVRIYPNPSNGKINIEMDKEYKLMTVEIVSASGQIVHQKDYSDVQTINLNLDLPKGIYFIRMSNDGFTRMEKVAVY